MSIAAPHPARRPATPSALAVLTRHEVVGYARSWTYLVGTALCLAVVTTGLVGPDDETSSTMTMIVPAATLGLLGLVVMARLTRRSDESAAAAGAVATSESTRTLALVGAVVVPLATALVVFALLGWTYSARPPAAGAVPFGPVDDAHVLAVMFALSVIPAVGGPLLGLLVARWMPFRGATALAVVLLALVTIVLQGNFESTWRWKVVWPWTYWYGPLGWSTAGGDETHWVATPGSPQLWIVYLLALCALGVVAALAHDAEAPRGRLVRTAVALGLVALGALALTMLLGLPDPAVNPVPGRAF